MAGEGETARSGKIKAKSQWRRRQRVGGDVFDFLVIKLQPGSFPMCGSRTALI